MTVNDAAMIVSITATCGGIFYKVCLSPLERSIDKLSRLIDEQSDMISNDRVKIAEVESSCSSAHHRIDRLDRIVDEWKGDRRGKIRLSGSHTGHRRIGWHSSSSCRCL